MSDEELKEKDEFKFVVNDLEDHILAQSFCDADPKHSDHLIGTVHAGKFEIISTLGQGGMSTVYKARHLLLDRVVALKLIQGSGLQSRVLQRFQQEARAATRLNHPNIATVREFGQDDTGSPYLVMDFVDGMPLDEAIRQSGSFSIERTEKIISDVCAGLKHAHDNGVVHRDLKPSNIILARNADGEEVARIVDFGIAKLIDEEKKTNLTHTGEVFGTPNYMSPEQCLGKPADHRSDVYAMGCVTFECLTGKPPFVRASALETLMCHVGEAPDLSTLRCPDNVKAAVQRCLAKSQDERWQSIDEFRNCLSDPNAKPINLIPPGKKIGARPFLIVALATFGGIIVCLSLALYPSIRNDFFPEPWEVSARQAQHEMSLGPSNYNNARGLLLKALREADEMGAPLSAKEQLNGQLGRLCSASNDFVGAEGYFRKALEMSAKHDVDFYRGSYNEWLSSLYFDQKNFVKAVEHGKKAVDIKYQVLGPDHRLTLTSVLIYGQALRANGQLAEAEKIDREALDMAKRVYPQRDNVEVANAYYQLANIQAQRGDISQAAENYVQSVTLSKKILGNDHPQTISNREHVMSFLKGNGFTRQLEELERVFQQ